MLDTAVGIALSLLALLLAVRVRVLEGGLQEAQHHAQYYCAAWEKAFARGEEQAEILRRKRDAEL